MKGTKVSKSVKKYVKKALDQNTEDKQAGAPLAVVNMDNIAQTLLINGITLGTQQGQRVGNRIRLKRAVGRVNFSQSGAAATLAPNSVRLLVVLDKQPNGAAPSYTQLFTNTTAGEEYLSAINVDGEKRYKVLYDKLFTLQVHGGSTNTPEEKTVRINIPLHKVITVYNGTGSTVAAVNTNALHFMYLSDTSSAAANPVVISAQWEIRYEDA